MRHARPFLFLAVRPCRFGRGDAPFLFNHAGATSFRRWYIQGEQTAIAYDTHHRKRLTCRTVISKWNNKWRR
jgi:hypothetical protein